MKPSQPNCTNAALLSPIISRHRPHCPAPYMTTLCLVFHDLFPADDPAASPLVRRGWALARELSGDGLSVTLLHTGNCSEETRRVLLKSASAAGVAYRNLADLVPAPAIEVFPAVEAHRTGLRLLEAVASIQPRSLVFFDGTANAAATVAARRCNPAALQSNIVVVLDNPQKYRLQADGLFPPWGRDAIAADFLERKAADGADGVVVTSGDLRQWLRAEGWSLPGSAPVIGLEGGADLSRAWRDAVSARPAVRALPAVPRVSVCVPYYEKPDYLAEALASLAAQTQAAHEVIVVDDGSTSPAATGALAAAEALYAPRGWRFLRQKNGGPAAARNLAAKSSTGDALLFCDSDNRFRPEMIADIGQALAASGADCVTCGFRAFRDANDGKAPDPGFIYAPLGACVELAALENVLGDTNFIIRRDAFLSRGGFPATNPAADEDWQFLLEYVRSEGRLEALPSVLFDYRMTSGGRPKRASERAAAEAVMAPVLAAAEPLWRRLWLFLAGAVRDKRLPQTEAVVEALKSTNEFQRGRLAQSEENLHLTRQHADGLEKMHDVLRRRVRELEDQCDHLTDAIRSRDEAIRAQQDSIERHQQAIRIREAKILAMSETFSWRSTSSLRFLRRKFLDSRRPKPAPAESQPPPAKPAEPPPPARPAPPPRFSYSVDFPQRWSFEPRRIPLGGWCHTGEGPNLVGIRAVLTGRMVDGCYGLKRQDVRVSTPDNPRAEYCGWSLDLDLKPEDKLLDLEVCDESGRWHHFFHTALQVGEGLGLPDLGDYDEWIKVYDSPDRQALKLQSELASALIDRPLISVLMPVYDTPEKWLVRAIESVQAQTYSNWELCIADDASPSGHVRPLLERFARNDPRVKVTFRERNGHIAAASNSALGLATGDYVALLDHDDELAPHALYEVAATLNAHPDTDWIYSDEDKIDTEGRRSEPYFKPDFLPDLFLSQNYTCHLAVYRASLVREVGGFREGFEGSQDWDLALRVFDATKPPLIRHIPRILYHWRAIPGSTALRLDEKTYPFEAAGRALSDHFRRRGVAVGLHQVAGGHWRIQYPLPADPPLASLIIPTRDGLSLLRTCVESILEKTTYPRFEILIVDNGSDDPEALDFLRSLADGSHPLLSAARGRTARVLRYDKPFNYSAINNFAVGQAAGEILALLNNDLEVITPGWLDEMASQALRPEIGCVGAMLYYPNDTVQHAGCVLGIGGVAGHLFKNLPRGREGRFNRARLVQNYSVLTGACLVMRKAVYQEVGGLDERDLAVAFNDVDLCLKVRAAGYLNLWTPFAEMYHHESASRGADNTREKADRFRREAETMIRRWGPVLSLDPAYNPNLSLDREDYSIGALPRPFFQANRPTA